MGPPNDGSEPWETKQFEHAYDATTPPSLAVVEAIENVRLLASTTRPGFTLYDHVDPDALDALLEDCGETGGLEVEFVTDRHRVLVDTGRVLVSERD